jgi:aryl-alcohol dehydrogenase-like predicted oxidoreductase
MDSTTRGAGRVKDGRGETPADKKIIDSVESIAKKRGVSMAEVAIAWSLGSEWVTAPIVGIRSTERLDELLKGLELKLTEEERKEINGHYEPTKVRGHE